MDQVAARLRRSLHDGPSFRLILGLCGATALVVVALVVGGRLSDLSVEVVLADRAETNGKRLLGSVSAAGSFTMAGGLGVCTLMATVLDRARDAAARAFFVASGAVTFLLLIDDYLLLHELFGEVLSDAFRFRLTTITKNTTEAAVFAVYGGILWVYVRRFWTIVSGPGFLLFSLAVAAGICSIAIDLANVVTPDRLDDFASLVEEGAKLLAFVFFSCFLGSTARCSLRASGGSR